MFLRGKQFLSWHIRRIKVKGNGRRQPTSSKNYPHFSALPGIPKDNLSAPGNDAGTVRGKSGPSLPCFADVLPLPGLDNMYGLLKCNHALLMQQQALEAEMRSEALNGHRQYELHIQKFPYPFWFIPTCFGK